MVPNERPRCFESFCSSLALSLPFPFSFIVISSSSSSLFSLSFSFLSFLLPLRFFLPSPTVTVTRLFVLYQRPFSQRWEKIRDMVVRGGVKQRRNIGYRGQEPLSNDSCVNCRGQESEAKGIPMERFLIEWENKSWMSNRIWNIYGWRPLVETKVRNGATDRLKIHVLTPSKGYSRNLKLKRRNVVHRKIVRFSFRSLMKIYLFQKRERKKESITSVCYFSISLTL